VSNLKFKIFNQLLALNMHVSILLIQHGNIFGLETPRQGLLEANEYLKSKGKSPCFEIELVATQPESSFQQGKYMVRADKLIDDVSKTDLILIPPVSGNIPEAMELNHTFYPWIKSQYSRGAQVVSFCMGAFILARTGLLDGKTCVTHWRAAEAFRNSFPQVKLLSDKLLTDEDGIYTGGGALSSANLVLYLIEKLVDRETALFCSKIFQIDVGRTSQSPFILFQGQKNHNDQRVLEIQHYIEENYANKLSVDDLCEYSCLGKRTVERRFKHATGNTILEYIQRIRIEAAKKSLELGNKQINEILYEVGYSDPKAFRKLFKKVTGMTPIRYKENFGKHVLPPKKNVSVQPA
jgi:transcriptional regulator GlxA family with amidase domain